MSSVPFLRPILDDESLARYLGDAEAQMIFEWLVERAEAVADDSETESQAERVISRLNRRARAIAKFVWLWCEKEDRGAAGQLASAERFEWSLPPADIDSWQLTRSILAFESHYAHAT